MPQFKTARDEVRHWTRVLNSFSRKDPQKQADLGGDGNDIEFEQAFCSLDPHNHLVR